MERIAKRGQSSFCANSCFTLNNVDKWNCIKQALIANIVMMAMVLFFHLSLQ